MKLSIITVNLNNKLGLKNTIFSVRSQIFQNFEYLVVDGNSSDGSLEIIKENQDYPSQIIIENDNGIYHAMNKGVNLASGDYLLFLNSGDIFYNSSVLFNSIQLLGNEEIIFGDLIWRDGLETCYPYTLNFSFLMKRSLPHQATFIKRYLFTEIGLYDEKIRIVSDWKFFLLCICKHNVTYKKIPLIISVLDSGGISDSKMNNTSRLIFQEKYQVLNSYFQPFLKDYALLEKYDRFLNWLKLRFWRKYFSKYRKSTAVSKYDW